MTDGGAMRLRQFTTSFMIRHVTPEMKRLEILRRIVLSVLILVVNG